MFHVKNYEKYIRIRSVSYMSQPPEGPMGPSGMGLLGLMPPPCELNVADLRYCELNVADLRVICRRPAIPSLRIRHSDTIAEPRLSRAYLRDLRRRPAIHSLRRAITAIYALRRAIISRVNRQRSALLSILSTTATMISCQLQATTRPHS